MKQVKVETWIRHCQRNSLRNSRKNAQKQAHKAFWSGFGHMGLGLAIVALYCVFIAMLAIGF